MNYVVNLDAGVDFKPASVEAEILQNVRTILSTRKGSVPLDRDFGISWEYLDRPIDVAQMLMRSEIVDAVSTYEPRAKVESVVFDSTSEDAMDGVLKPTVTISIV